MKPETNTATVILDGLMKKGSNPITKNALEIGKGKHPLQKLILSIEMLDRDNEG